MKNILIFGAGHIGCTISTLLATSGDYSVVVADPFADLTAIQAEFNHLNINFISLNVHDKPAVAKAIKENNIDAIVCCMPHGLTVNVAQHAHDNNCHYFDLTEDVASAEKITKLSQGASTAFVSQCGLAPGFITIVANNLIGKFTEVSSVKCRVGALPQEITNSLKYAYTWSLDGLVNEYIRPCLVLKDGKQTTVPGLSGLESLELNGEQFEAFYTSGGIGSLPETYQGKIQNIDYKTLRYTGHHEKIDFLLNDLRLRDEPETLVKILERALPRTLKDTAVTYVSVSGQQDGKDVEERFFCKYYPQEVNNITFTALQITTASSLCAVLDMVLQSPEKYQGFVKQEQFPLSKFLENRFGNIFNNQK